MRTNCQFPVFNRFATAAKPRACGKISTVEVEFGENEKAWVCELHAAEVEELKLKEKTAAKLKESYATRTIQSV